MKKAKSKYPFQNLTLSFESRARDLVSRMTLDEKISQMMDSAPGIPRLGVPPYQWWNECLHGVARAGVATVFPQAMGLAATFDQELMQKVAVAISDEARAKHHESLRQGDHGIYKGLTFWSPNINLFRDPRWGRGQETYGEDPYLTGRMGLAFVKGLQGDDPRYLKLVATAKHYAVHSGPEGKRHGFDAKASPQDLRETYLPAFKMLLKEGRAASVMTAYNRTNGAPCSCSRELIGKILRQEWGFKGYVVSDCGAVQDIHSGHRTACDFPEAGALAVKAGCDLECGQAYKELRKAVKRGILSEADINRCAERLFYARFKLGMFDPPSKVPFARIPYDIVDCPAHQALNRRTAADTMVLLKNQGGLLPLKPSVESIAVIGPAAADYSVLVGNYEGTPAAPVRLVDGIRKAVSNRVKVRYAAGCEFAREDASGFAEAVSAAERADVCVLCLGMAPGYEGEENPQSLLPGQGDRLDLGLPPIQQRLLEALHATGKPIVLVTTGGCPQSIGWARRHVPAILHAWYPGGLGGEALAAVLFGRANPSARLPITIVESGKDLPAFEDYSMAGRTYRFFKGRPLFPFGFGLSYTSFAYSGLKFSAARLNAGQALKVSAIIRNTGKHAGAEVPQAYLSDLKSSVRVPLRQLVWFGKVFLKPGEKRKISFEVSPRQMALINRQGEAWLEPGRFLLCLGGSQPDSMSRSLGAGPVVKKQFEVRGSARKLEA